MKILYSLSVATLCFFAFSLLAFAASDYSIRPFLLHETLQPRDIVTKEIVISNDSNKKLTLYATVNEITVDTEGEIKEFISPVMTDRTVNIGSWIEITRGRISLEPGESTTTPITFKINPNAETGEYHAFIGFTNTNKRFKAEEAALAGQAPGLPVKITISETIYTSLSITKFHIPRFIIFDKNRIGSLELLNNGEITETPTGEIIFYDSKGTEIAATDVNSELQQVGSESTETISVEVPLISKIGRYKANLVLNYGVSSTSQVFDTAEFFVLPWYLVLLLLLLIITVSLVVTYLLKRAFEDHMVTEQEEVDVFLRDNTGHFSQEKDHDITLNKS